MCSLRSPTVYALGPLKVEQAGKVSKCSPTPFLEHCLQVFKKGRRGDINYIKAKM